MSVEWPVLVLAVLLVPAGIAVARRLDARRRARVATLGGALGVPPAAGERAVPRDGDRGSLAGTRAGPAPAGRPVGRALDALPAVLVVAALVVMALSLARPSATVALPRLEGTLMLVVDVSGSMAAGDVEPSRMEAARSIANEIVERRPEGVVIGVVVFSDAGVAVQAPTSDAADVQAAIARLVPTRGTSIGGGILSALAAIEEARAPTPAEYYSNRSPTPSPAFVPREPGSDAATIVVVLSDGEANVDPDPAEAALAAAERGIRIAAIGVGTPQGVVLDLDGFQVETRLDEASLERLAELTAGSYTRASDGDAAAAVYDELARALVVREEPVELTAIGAAVALVLLVAGVSLSLARSGRLP